MLESFGALGTDAKAVLRIIAKEAEYSRLRSYKAFLVHALAAISVALQRGNARLALDYRRAVM